MSSITNRAESAGQQAHDSEWIDRAARVGLVAYGVVHLLIAWLAVQLALGDREGSADSQGAVQQLNEQPFGQVLVWAVAVGLFLLAIWQVLEAIFGYRDEEGFTQVRKRATAAGKAVIYVVIGISAVRAATGSSSSKKGGTDSTTAKVMDWPGGQVVIGALGLAIIGIGGYLVYRAWTEKFAKHINAEGKSGDSGTAYLWFGKAGYTAKGVTFGIIGGLFLYAALTHDPKKSGGLDQALHKVLQQPFGPVLLIAIALGLACYGLFCFARARHFND
jgi:multisubunit Na+/H+ antiporter MnhB subunit